MTKEEILFSFPQGESEPYGHVPINRIYEAMDEYAKEVAIGFADWVEKNYSFSFGSYERIDPTTAKVVLPHVEYTTEQLFNLYLNHISKTTKE